MKKMMMLMIMALSFSVMANPGYKDEMNLTDEQKTAWKALKKEKGEAIKAAKKEIYADYDERLAEILDDEQMAHYKEMKKHKKAHTKMKKHKKRKHKKRMSEEG